MTQFFIVAACALLVQPVTAANVIKINQSGSVIYLSSQLSQSPFVFTNQSSYVGDMSPGLSSAHEAAYPRELSLRPVASCVPTFTDLQSNLS